jgi:hypothetical protein
MKQSTLLVLLAVAGVAAYFLLKKPAEPRTGFGLTLGEGTFGVSYMS